MRSRKQIPIIIPRKLIDKLIRAVESEAISRGIDPSSLEIGKKELEVVPGIIMTWQVYYVNTAGFRKYVSYANESGKNLAILRGNSVKIISNLDLSSIEVVELGSGDYEISGKITSFSTAVATKKLKSTLSSRLRVPKKAVNIVHKQKVLYATKIRTKISSGKGSGSIEVRKGYEDWKVKWDPLPDNQLENLAIQLATDSGILDRPKVVSPETKLSEKRVKAGVKRSWDTFFGTKRRGPLAGGAISEPSSLGVSPVKILSKKLDKYYGIFILCKEDICGVVALNRYSGLEISKFTLPTLKEIENLVSKYFNDQLSTEVLDIEGLGDGGLETKEYSLIAELSTEKQKRELRFLTKWIVRPKLSPMKVIISFNPRTRELNIPYVEPDGSRVSEFLKRLLGEIERWESEFDPPNLYIKARSLDGTWRLLRFSTENFSRFSPEDHLIIEGATKDPISEINLLFCRDFLRQKEGCTVIGLYAGEEVLFRTNAPCLNELLASAHAEISSRYYTKVQLSLISEIDPDILVPKLSMVDIFTKTHRPSERPLVHIKGRDLEGNFDFLARYDVISKNLNLEVPKIREEAPQKIARKLISTEEIEDVKWRYSYPSLKMRLKTATGSLISLKVDLSNISSPRIVEKKTYKPSILNFLRWILPM